MEKNRIVKRIVTVVLLVIALIGLNMQGMSVFAETLNPEGLSEATEDQPESRSETLEEGESEVQTEKEETELSEGESDERTEMAEEQSVSRNGISDADAEEQDGKVAVLADEDAETGGADADNTDNKLTDAALEECIVKGINPPGVTVNLFDYWQDNVPQEELDKGIKEVAHDFCYWVNNAPDYSQSVTTFNLGISRGHLLRFGYRSDAKNDYCTDEVNGIKLGDYGAWNEYNKTKPSQEIVKKQLSPDGFPVLNLSGKDNEYYGRYADAENLLDYLTDEKKTESLAYLFSPDVQNQFKESYNAVQGLFQQDANGYYYYDSQKNFASFNENTNSFILYNSPGVAKVDDNDDSGAEFCGQFFPFNTAKDVFDSYIKKNDGSYRLIYQDIEKQKNSDYAPVMDGENGYIKCYAPNLNHYFGLTLEMQFVQPAGGRVNGDTGASDMIFSFSGDDDVWIFIDDVLVADLGGLHDALGLSINFANGDVEVAGEKSNLYNAFVTAYGENSNLGGVEFNGDTFADNTTHTLKMFYLERGHMASNLSLSFNIQPLPSPPGDNEDKEDVEDKEDKEDKDNNIYETEEDTPDSYTDSGTDTNANVTVEVPVSDNTLIDNTEIPKTGDDSLIGWWAALCIISLIGIGATVCNLIIRKRKRDKQS